MFALVELTDGGVHPPDEMPFAVPWTRTPLPQRRWDTMQHFWQQWASWRPTSWTLPFASTCDGEVVGMISLEADDFPDRRVVGTGSWIGLGHQGVGFGTEQRAAVLAFAFDHLGAVRATSAAWETNIASRRVSEKLGYRHNGDHLGVVEGRRRRGVSFAIDRDDWERERATNPLHVPVTYEGVAEALPQFGL